MLFTLTGNCFVYFVKKRVATILNH